MIQAVINWPTIEQDCDPSRPVHVGYVVDKVVLQKLFLRELYFSLVSIIPLMLHYYISFIYH
jgi:hypothetical protein